MYHNEKHILLIYAIIIGFIFLILASTVWGHGDANCDDGWKISHGLPCDRANLFAEQGIYEHADQRHFHCYVREDRHYGVLFAPGSYITESFGSPCNPTPRTKPTRIYTDPEPEPIRSYTQIPIEHKAVEAEVQDKETPSLPEPEDPNATETEVNTDTVVNIELYEHIFYTGWNIIYLPVVYEWSTHPVIKTVIDFGNNVYAVNLPHWNITGFRGIAHEMNEVVLQSGVNVVAYPEEVKMTCIIQEDGVFLYSDTAPAKQAVIVIHVAAAPSAHRTLATTWGAIKNEQR